MLSYGNKMILVAELAHAAGLEDKHLSTIYRLYLWFLWTKLWNLLREWGNMIAVQLENATTLEYIRKTM